MCIRDSRYSDDLGIKELRQELRRVKYNNKFAATLFNTVGTLVVAVSYTHLDVYKRQADGYARSTGKVGVCLATSGPGATNLVTGISTAYMDSIPIDVYKRQIPYHLHLRMIMEFMLHLTGIISQMMS